MTKRIFITCLIWAFTTSFNAAYSADSLYSDSAFDDFLGVFHQELYDSDREFSLEAGAAYSYWKPKRIGNTEMETQGLNLFWIEFGSRTLRTIDKIWSIPKLRFQKSFVGNLFSDSDEVIETSLKSQESSYMRFVGMLQLFLPITFRYETETYISELTAEKEFSYVPYTEEDIIPIYRGDKLYHQTSFYDYALEWETSPGLFMGAFFSEYQKPYALASDLVEEIEEDFIFYSTIRSYGGVIEKINSSFYVDGLTMDWAVKLGIGDVNLTKTADVSYFLSEDERVAIFNPQIDLGFQKHLSDRLLINIFGSVDWRYFYRYGDEGEEDSDTEAINSDLLLKVFAAIGFTF